MHKLFRRIAAYCGALFALTVLCAALPRPAAAISPPNKQLLQDRFASLGDVKYELYSPYGGAETGAALIDVGGSTQLRVMEVGDRGRIEDLVNEPFPLVKGARPLTFFLNGRHLVTYNAHELTGGDGRRHVVGDLVIRDLKAEGGVKEIYRLSRVVDLDYSPGGLDSSNNMIAQPAQSFLNSFARLPQKDTHLMLAYNYDTDTYELKHPIGALPDAATDEAANYNNRAVIYYYAGEPLEASRLLEKAWVATDFTQAVVQANQRFVKAEMEVLGENKQETKEFDEALSHFWQGDFEACLHVLKARYDAGPSSFDMVLMALSLAQLDRWPEADNWAIHLASQHTKFEADLLAAMMRIAEFQGHDEVVARYREALEASDPNHPGLFAAKARALRRDGKIGEAEALLASYLDRPHAPQANLAEPLMTLYDMYRADGNQSGIEHLQQLALTGDIYSLLPYVHMTDYQDLSGAMVEIKPPETEHVEIPDSVLKNMIGGGNGGG